MDTSLVSVIIPYHNEGDLVNRAIASACDQTYEGALEVIVVDDGSTIPPPLRNDYGKPVRVVHTQGGLYAGGARNLGVAQSKGNVICFLDADDSYLPNRIAAHVELLERHPDLAFVGGHTLVHRKEISIKTPVQIDAKYKRLVTQPCVLPESVRLDSCLEYPFHTSAITVRRSFFNAVGGFEQSYWWGEDWDLQVKLSQLGRVGYVPEIVSNYFCREGSICSTLNPRKFESAARVYRNWRLTIRQLPFSYKKILRQREHEALLLASQVYLENQHKPQVALFCALAAQASGISVWGVRSTVRTLLHTVLGRVGLV